MRWIGYDSRAVNDTVSGKQVIHLTPSQKVTRGSYGKCGRYRYLNTELAVMDYESERMTVRSLLFFSGARSEVFSELSANYGKLLGEVFPSIVVLLVLPE